jgi:hypothetical protein
VATLSQRAGKTVEPFYLQTHYTENDAKSQTLFYQVLEYEILKSPPFMGGGLRWISGSQRKMLIKWLHLPTGWLYNLRDFGLFGNSPCFPEKRNHE